MTAAVLVAMREEVTAEAVMVVEWVAAVGEAMGEESVVVAMEEVAVAPGMVVAAAPETEVAAAPETEVALALGMREA